MIFLLCKFVFSATFGQSLFSIFLSECLIFVLKSPESFKPKSGRVGLQCKDVRERVRSRPASTISIRYGCEAGLIAMSRPNVDMLAFVIAPTFYVMLNWKMAGQPIVSLMASPHFTVMHRRKRKLKRCAWLFKHELTWQKM